MSAKPVILVVDDEPFYTEVLENLLRDEYIIVSADSGEAALRMIDQEPRPELVLLDILMPGIDGYETCKRLKSNPATTKIPIIFLTVRSDVDDEVRGFQMGAVDYITKPMSPPIVKARVRTHVGLTRIQTQLENIINQEFS